MNARTWVSARLRRPVPGDPAAPETAPTMTRVRGRLLWPALLYVPALLLLLAVAVAAATTGISPQRFLLDPAVLAGSHPLLGVVSNIGILIWAATAAITLFTATLPGMKRQAREHKVFLLAAGLLTSWLALDDLFMIHEWLVPQVLAVPQTLVLAAYAGLAGCFLLRFAALILRTDFLLLALALAFLSVSVCVDALPNTWFAAWNWLYLVEDGFKLLGIVGWFGYFSRVCASFLGARAS